MYQAAAACSSMVPQHALLVQTAAVHHHRAAPVAKPLGLQRLPGTPWRMKVAARECVRQRNPEGGEREGTLCWAHTAAEAVVPNAAEHTSAAH